MIKSETVMAPTPLQLPRRLKRAFLLAPFVVFVLIYLVVAAVNYAAMRSLNGPELPAPWFPVLYALFPAAIALLTAAQLSLLGYLSWFCVAFLKRYRARRAARKRSTGTLGVDDRASAADGSHLQQGVHPFKDLHETTA
ncbi:hypothetical protein ACSFA0_23585 [Variovorax sp. LT1P1]|uniref:hypothetical protein n=1 Tax=Variovorax sp. LT1P1 TaxID=3443730 RepID=UPI003F4804E6